jgi:hypothetical protein
MTTGGRTSGGATCPRLTVVTGPAGGGGAARQRVRHRPRPSAAAPRAACARESRPSSPITRPTACRAAAVPRTDGGAQRRRVRRRLGHGRPAGAVGGRADRGRLGACRANGEGCVGGRQEIGKTHDPCILSWPNRQPHTHEPLGAMQRNHLTSSTTPDRAPWSGLRGVACTDGAAERRAAVKTEEGGRRAEPHTTSPWPHARPRCALPSRPFPPRAAQPHACAQPQPQCAPLSWSR